MKLKVLVISDYRDYISARPEAELYIGLQKAGLDVTIMTYPGTAWAKEFQAAGMLVIEYHPQQKRSRTAINYIRSVVREGGYHILHLYNSLASSNGIPAAKGLPVKVLLYRGYTGNVHWWDPTMYFKYLHPRVDKIFCITKEIENIFKRNTLFGKHKAVTIVKGHNPVWYQHVQPVSSFEQWGVPKDAFVVICVANVRPMKGIPYLLKATQELPAGLPIHFVFIGAGFDRKEIQQLIQQSTYRTQIHCIGFVPDPLPLVAAAQVFVLPSVKGEGLSKATIEAMALGVAPVVTSIPGNTDIVVHEQSGLLVPPADPSALAAAILRLYQEEPVRRQLAVQARQRIETDFHINTTIREMKRLYEELAGPLPR